MLWMDEVRAYKDAEAFRRDQSLLCTQPTTEANKGRTHKWQTLAEPQQTAASVVADISDSVRAKVVIRMRGAPVMDLITSDMF